MAAAALALLRSKGSRGVLPGLLSVAAIGFWGSPMNWWARYTVWIYGAGLPCVAVLLHFATARAGSRWRLIPRLAVAGWLLWCSSVTFREADLALVQMTRNVYPSAWPANALEILKRANWKRDENFLFPETRGTILDQILRAPCTVAIEGNMWGVLGWRFKHNILGALSMPIGRHKIVPMSYTLPELRSAGVRYIIIDDVEAVPPTLSALASRVEHPPGFGCWSSNDKERRLFVFPISAFYESGASARLEGCAPFRAGADSNDS
jgi:hypothetical protein